jgi:hypothetical protein
MKWLVTILAAGFFTGFASANTNSPASDTPERLPGVDLAERASEITGVGISPLLGMSSVGAWKYYHTPTAKRHLLPWFCHPIVWGIGLGIVALCILKDTLGTATPPFLKKPFDVMELFENKLSGLVAAAAFVPLVAHGLKTFNEPLAGGTAFGFQCGFPFLAMIHVSPKIILVPFAIAAFLVVWLAFHVINVLIVLSPFGFVDALLKIARTGMLLLIPVSYLIHPYFALTVCLIILVVSCFVARWAFRLTLFGTVFALDLVPFRSFGKDLLTKPIRAFTTRRVGTVPVRAYGSVQLNQNGQLMFTYRPWLFLAPTSAVLPGEAFALSKGLLCPVLLHKRTIDDRDRFLLLLLPRYRSRTQEIALLLGFAEVREGVTARGLKAIRNWFTEMFRGRSTEKSADIEPLPGNFAS